LLAKNFLTIKLVSCFGSIILVVKSDKCVTFPSVVSIGHSPELLELGLQLGVADPLVDAVDEELAALLCVGSHHKFLGVRKQRDFRSKRSLL